jgi:chemotaxis protein methyltransferase CheR
MTVSLSQNMLKTMVDWVDLHIGLKVSDVRLNDFAKGVCLAAADSGFEDPQQYIAELVRSTPREHELGFLASYLTVGETYFFRDPLSFNLLSTRVLPSLCDTGNPIRIWSAGCASGEEPYSIAITALSSMGEQDRENLEILATDINPRYLDIAKTGLYRRWSFREVPSFIKDKYFKLTADDRYCLDERVKKLVRFNYLNLASDAYPSALTGTDEVDVIFCRNVLIYFSPEHVTEVLNRFHRSLKDGGYLFLAPSEIPHPAPENFKLVNVDGAILLRKEGPVVETKPSVVSIVQSNFAYFGQTIAPNMKSFESLIDVNDGARKPIVSGPDSLSNHEAAALLASLQAGLSDAGSDTPHGVSSINTGITHGAAYLTGGDEEFYSADSVMTEEDLEDVVKAATKLYHQGMYSEAIDLLLELPVSHDPNCEDAFLLLVKAYANIGNLDAAMDWSERLIGYEPINARWYYLRATIQQELGEDGAASISLRQAIFLEPEFVLAHFSLGNIHRQSGDQMLAKRCFQRVVDLLSTVDSASELEDSDGLMAGQLMTIVKSLVDGG